MKVLNKYKASADELSVGYYIGRPSVLMNPFKMSDSLSRSDVCRLFRLYFIKEIVTRNPAILKALAELTENTDLICFCKPHDCHGDFVKEVWEFFNRSGGVYESLELFDWTYGDEVKEERPMSTTVLYDTIQKLLAIEHPEHKDITDDEKGFELYQKHIYRGIMNRDPLIENLINGILNDRSQLTYVAMTPYEQKKVTFICKTIDELTVDIGKYGSYDEAVRHFRDDHNHDRIDYSPDGDGITHINVYSRGRTELGRLLSNFAHTPFKHPYYGFFSSVEAFWYWLSLGKKHDNLRSLYGISAKKAGAVINEELATNGNKRPHIENFEAEIKFAILCKIEQNERLRDILKSSTLPLTHYYVWGDDKNYRVTYPEEYKWIHEYISDVREFLNGHAYKTVIAGSRNIDNLDLVRATYDNLGIKTVLFISGMARGVDTNAIKLAEEKKIPCLMMPADWDKHKKAAGFIRNDEMAQIATFALIFWDTVSHGTKQMIERCQHHGVKDVVIKVKGG